MRSIASRMSVMSGEGALSVFARAKELEAEGRSIIHLELGEPDFHPGKSVIESAGKALADGKDRYCAVAGVPALREEIADYLDRTRRICVSPANIVLAPGCKLALFLGMMALLEPGDEVDIRPLRLDWARFPYLLRCRGAIIFSQILRKLRRRSHRARVC